VDDEPWALRGVRDVFPWELLGAEVIGAFSDSGQAFEQLLHKRPDIVVTDIKMPGMSGLEIIRYARECGIDSEFIIVSGYDDFSYAQQAIRYGVFAYLLKPLISESAADTCRRLAAHLHGKSSLDEVSGERFVDMLFDDDVAEKMSAMPIGAEHVVLCARLVRIHKQILDGLLEGARCYELGGDQYLYVMAAAGIAPDWDDSAVRERFGALLSSSVSIGQSKPFSRPEHFAEAVEQAQIAALNMFFCGSPRLIRKYRSMRVGDDLRVADACIALLGKRKSGELVACLRNYLQPAGCEAPGIEDVALIHNRLAAYAEDTYPAETSGRAFGFLQYEQLADRYANIADYLEDLGRTCDYVCSAGPVAQLRGNRVFDDILAYIQAHYSSSIYLNEIAQKFYVSPTYICDMFRKYMQTTFTRYTNKLRLENARRLICGTDRPLSGIAQAMGYTNYYYFNKIFKNKYGVTPGALRKANGKQNADS
jgi:AraC-like DNA-binding protein/DNA-binding NarL/FixJ family response regulator